MIKKFLLALIIAASVSSVAFSQEAAVVAVEETDMETDDVIPAPPFTLKDIDGNDVSLSDFRGKWVVLDFWGKWCRFCVQGIPAMKEAYATYHPKGLEIIGIDCRDSLQVWKDAVEQYQLPWVNVYNPADSSLLEDYAIQGFPSKFIVDPEGNIITLFLGEDPDFYEFLKQLFQ